MASISFQPTTFTPAEAEAITGVDGVQQRNLRRYGYLPKTAKGWTRFSIKEVARLLVIGRLAEREIPPGTSSKIADSAAMLILVFAQVVPGAVEDPERCARGEMPVKASSAGPRRFLLSYGNDKKKFWFENDLMNFYSRKWDADISAAIILDLQRLAETLCQRAGRPLWRVVEDD